MLPQLPVYTNMWFRNVGNVVVRDSMLVNYSCRSIPSFTEINVKDKAYSINNFESKQPSVDYSYQIRNDRIETLMIEK